MLIDAFLGRLDVSRTAGHNCIDSGQIRGNDALCQGSCIVASKRPIYDRFSSGDHFNSVGKDLLLFMITESRGLSGCAQTHDHIHAAIDHMIQHIGEGFVIDLS